ncbi:hypothetical protein Fmac_025193 [Flemingia macrophylla]|uniref:Uncharacterized protein n=1 Tax=Flemingia macrophylla TaxID=520843 RepID=A0ABD1LT90_9FABA
MQQPAIPPLLGEGGVRCSVKPASRCALQSKNHETCAFAQVPWLNSQLGVDRPHFAEPHPNPAKPICCSISFMPSLESQAGVTQLGEPTTCQNVYKHSLF